MKKLGEPRKESQEEYRFHAYLCCARLRTEAERFKPYSYEELTQRDKANLDITWIKDASLEELENLPEPEILAAEIIENLEDALEQFRSIQETLEEN